MAKELLYGVGIFIPVSDLDKSTKWYEEMLDFELIHSDEPNAKTFRTCDGKVIFTLVKCENITQPKFPKNDYDVGVYYNFLTTDIDTIHQEMLAKDGNVSLIHDYGDVKGFSITDLDGNRFGIVT
ncbi:MULTISPECIES: VOC family protein [Sutcliffiella]|uniref:Glyoxalase n=1 Tax=Sutcliffiella cohnii TaxID=33932 RepID=A0A223KN43_9BACI|nr:MULTISPECIES: VOC family protein [Sutcliffiella]AST90778.1 glyoxalase [Sutcliffiella cohnii]MED4017932.1 VOC family protein [Sutcliffiella cohnii]WBL16567.1 VOC family protein [Sutcliffiella sp. NC1]